MAKVNTTGEYSAADYEESVDPAFKALILQQVMPNENAHEVFNSLVKQNRCKRLYENDGSTKPVSAIALHLEAERAIAHSIKLNRNLDKQAKVNQDLVSKQLGDESHHVVAAREPRAAVSRRIIFSVGIGINSWQNGLNMRREEHRPIHTSVYYMEVTRLLGIAERSCHAKELNERHAMIEDGLLTIKDDIENNNISY